MERPRQTPLSKRTDRAQQSSTKSPLQRLAANQSLTPEEIEEMRETFNLFDTEGTGVIDPKELKAAMQSLALDTEENSKGITFEQYLTVITSKLGNQETRDGINSLFDLFDDEKTGTINLRNMKRVAQSLGENPTLDELKEILARTASNREEITRDDFYNIMTKKTFT